MRIKKSEFEKIKVGALLYAEDLLYYDGENWKAGQLCRVKKVYDDILRADVIDENYETEEQRIVDETTISKNDILLYELITETTEEEI